MTRYAEELLRKNAMEDQIVLSPVALDWHVDIIRHKRRRNGDVVIASISKVIFSGDDAKELAAEYAKSRRKPS